MATSLLQFSFKNVSSNMVQSVVTADAALTAPIQEQIINMYSSYAALPGYEHAQLPQKYTANYFAKEVKHDTQQFIFKHFVMDYLLKSLVDNNVVVTNWPRLIKVESEENGNITYRFLVSQASDLPLKEWKHFVFKQPARKNYKDLDKQVTSFLKEGIDLYRKLDKTLIEAGDWIQFEVRLVTPETHKPLLKEVSHPYWLRMTSHTVSSELQKSFLHKHIDDVFTIPSLPFTNSPYGNTQEPCHYEITIKGITKGAHLCLDFFKSNFRLKTRAEVHKKLIEVFSYRNDISQRHAIIEELFHLLFTKHRFEVPKHIVTRRRELILQELKKKPDYHVYKGHKDFQRYVESLSEKLLKEEIMIDNIANAEDITVTQQDIAHYLHMFNNERLKEFIYFKPLINNIEDTDTPLHEGMLIQAIRREKTLNHIVYILS